MADQRLANRLTRAQIPHPHRLPATGDGKRHPVYHRARHRRHRISVADKWVADRLPVAQIPQPHGRVETAGDGKRHPVYHCACHRAHHVGVAAEGVAQIGRERRARRPYRRPLACRRAVVQLLLQVVCAGAGGVEG